MTPREQAGTQLRTPREAKPCALHPTGSRHSPGPPHVGVTDPLLLEGAGPAPGDPALSQPPRDATRAPQPLRAGGQGPGLETRPSDPSACPADNTPASPSALPSRHHVTAHGQRYPHRQGHAWGSLIKACLSLPSCLPRDQGGCTKAVSGTNKAHGGVRDGTVCVLVSPASLSSMQLG